MHYKNVMQTVSLRKGQTKSFTTNLLEYVLFLDSMLFEVMFDYIYTTN